MQLPMLQTLHPLPCYLNPIEFSHMKELGVQQCFGVVYHDLTTLRRVYFGRAALAARAK